jgi:hypothetical protein
MKRTVLKTLAYKLLATVELALVTWCITGSLHEYWRGAHRGVNCDLRRV